LHKINFLVEIRKREKGKGEKGKGKIKCVINEDAIFEATSKIKAVRFV
jgi:hypothetical protein